MLRTEKYVLVGFNRTSTAATAVGSVAVVVAKETAASGEKVMKPFGDDDALVRVKT